MAHVHCVREDLPATARLTESSSATVSRTRSGQMTCSAASSARLYPSLSSSVRRPRPAGIGDPILVDDNRNGAALREVEQRPQVARQPRRPEIEQREPTRIVREAGRESLKLRRSAGDPRPPVPRSSVEDRKPCRRGNGAIVAATAILLVRTPARAASIRMPPSFSTKPASRSPTEDRAARRHGPRPSGGPPCATRRKFHIVVDRSHGRRERFDVVDVGQQPVLTVGDELRGLTDAGRHELGLPPPSPRARSSVHPPAAT